MKFREKLSIILASLIAGTTIATIVFNGTIQIWASQVSSYFLAISIVWLLVDEPKEES